MLRLGAVAAGGIVAGIAGLIAVVVGAFRLADKTDPPSD